MYSKRAQLEPLYSEQIPTLITNSFHLEKIIALRRKNFTKVILVRAQILKNSYKKSGITRHLYHKQTCALQTPEKGYGNKNTRKSPTGSVEIHEPFQLFTTRIKLSKQMLHQRESHVFRQGQTEQCLSTEYRRLTFGCSQHDSKHF